ncbi:hypothetical protein C4577_06465 [Candidatus Parcubacteria bacterium]|nr:MAG: hypothetical protein C4577_06465 [Candidatus Parcubacteria bacterium]
MNAFFPIEDLLDCLQRFPQGSVVRMPLEVVVYTHHSYNGKSEFDLFDKNLPNWNNPDNDEDLR